MFSLIFSEFRIWALGNTTVSSPRTIACELWTARVWIPQLPYLTVYIISSSTMLYPLLSPLSLDSRPFSWHHDQRPSSLCDFTSAHLPGIQLMPKTHANRRSLLASTDSVPKGEDVLWRTNPCLSIIHQYRWAWHIWEGFSVYIFNEWIR